MAAETQTAPADTIEEYADNTVAGIVADKQKKPEGETVGEFADDVQAKAKEHVEDVREAAGDEVAELVGPEIMESAEGYAEAKKDILDTDANVGDAAAIGAAAYVDMGTREMTHDTAAMDFDMTAEEEAYRRRTNDHENVHQHEQAAEFNAAELHVVDESGVVKTVEVEGTLTEGQATQKNETSDLTPDYVQHQKDWRTLAKTFGEADMNTAMKTGDIQTLQKKHLEKVLGPDFALAA